MSKRFLTAFCLAVCSLSCTVLAVAVCPKSIDLFPCKCENNNQIKCNSTESYELKHIFELIKKNSPTNPDDEEIKFESFVIENYHQAVIPEDVFKEISIKNIEIVDSNITSIDRNAFSRTTLYTENLSIRSTLLDNKGTKERDIYEAVSKMFHLKSLYLIDNEISTIPEHAFRKTLGTQASLRTLSIADDKIYHIGDNAFYDLPGLAKLELYNNKINKIGILTLAFENQSNRTLEVDLRNNLIDSSSFEHLWYSKTKRPMKLNLSNNKISFISENIFSTFLNREHENSINVENNPIICDCKAKWLVEEIDFYKTKVFGMKCPDGRDIFKWNISEFSQCVDKPDTKK